MMFDYISLKVWSSKTETPGFILEGDDWLLNGDEGDLNFEYVGIGTNVSESTLKKGWII